MDRRSLLKSAAALTATAAIPSAAAQAVAVESAPVAPLVTPAKLSPYADYVWEWFVSHNGEVYHEGFPTKEEAVAYAQQCDYAIVAECKPQDFDLSIDGEWLLEHLDEQNYDRIGGGDGIAATQAQRAELGDMVTRAIEAWVVKNNIDIRAWSFGGHQNETRVDLPTHPV